MLPAHFDAAVYFFIKGTHDAHLGYDHVPIKQMLVFALSKIVSREIFYAKKTTDESLLYEPFAERK